MWPKPEFRYRNKNKTWELISMLGFPLSLTYEASRLSVSNTRLWLFPQGRPQGRLMRWASFLVFRVSSFWGTCSFFVGKLESFLPVFVPVYALRWVSGLYLNRLALLREWSFFKKLLDFLRGTIKGAWSLILLRQCCKKEERGASCWQTFFPWRSFRKKMRMCLCVWLHSCVTLFHQRKIKKSQLSLKENNEHTFFEEKKKPTTANQHSSFWKEEDIIFQRVPPDLSSFHLGTLNDVPCLGACIFLILFLLFCGEMKVTAGT